MKHLFVPYDIALALKEKGFDESCLAFYYGQLKKLEIGFNWLSEGCRNSLIESFIAAPLYQQVCDWFREKHNIHIDVSHWRKQPVGDEIWDNCYQTFINGDAGDVSIFRTYYEALTKAIEEALKLIP